MKHNSTKILNKKNNSKKGFTLIEIMVSVAIFTIIITTGMGALVSITRSYQVSQNQKRVYDGLNYALETMAREIRLGKNYSANQSGGNDGVGSVINFTATDGRGNVRYFLSGGALRIQRTGATAAQNISSPITDTSEIIVENVRFTVIGTETRDNGNFQQPLVWIQITARAANESSVDLSTTVQTLVSQRTLDF